MAYVFHARIIALVFLMAIVYNADYVHEKTNKNRPKYL